MLIRRLLALMFFLFAGLPATAQQVLEVPVRGEILSGWQQADGTRIAALRLTLAPGWKTYWRAPGDSGIPPQFDWRQSSNLGGITPLWPAPQVFREGGVLTIGYKEELVLPLAIAPRQAGRPVRLSVTLDIGVCSDICIPHRMKIEGLLEDTSRSPTPDIAAALAARPLSAREAGAGRAICSLRPNADGLEITAHMDMPSQGGGEVVVIEPGSPGVWMSEMDVSRLGRSLTAVGDMVPTGGGPMSLDRSGVTITVLGERGAVELKGCAAG